MHERLVLRHSLGWGLMMGFAFPWISRMCLSCPNALKQICLSPNPDYSWWITIRDFHVKLDGKLYCFPCLRVHFGKCQQASSIQLSEFVEIKPSNLTVQGNAACWFDAYTRRAGQQVSDFDGLRKGLPLRSCPVFGKMLDTTAAG